MKRIVSVLTFLALMFGLMPSSQASDLIILSKNGATISFVNPIYSVVGSSTIYADYSNQTGFGILIFGYELTDKFGTSLTEGSELMVRDGTSGRMGHYWSEYAISKGTAPYTLTMKITYNAVHNKPNDYFSVPFAFVSRSENAQNPVPAVTPKPTPTPTPTPTIKNLVAPEFAPETSLRWQGTTLYAKVQVPAGIKNEPTSVEGIKARLFYGSVPISVKDSIQPLTINQAYEVNFTWELSSVWKSLLLADWLMRVETEFYNSAGSGMKQTSEIAVDKSAMSPPPASTVTATAKRVTITCVKGKLSKKISAVKPKCPIGYKVKK